MNELDFYNRQYQTYQRYDHNRASTKLDLERPEDYFLYLVSQLSGENKTLVDLGCGDGFFTAKMATLNDTTIGVEPSDLILAAKQHLQQHPVEGLSFVREDAYAMSLADNSVDLVISRRGPDPADEIARVLKPGGRFAFITIGEKDCRELKEYVGRGQHYRLIGTVRRSLIRRYEDAGFCIDQCIDFNYEEAYDSQQQLTDFLHQVPIIDHFSQCDSKHIDAYCAQFDQAGPKLNRHRVVLTATKRG